MAFVRSVGAKTLDADRPLETRLTEAAPARPSMTEREMTERKTTERPADVLPPRLSPIGHSLARHGDLREEVGRRVAAFRARQLAFNHERDEYFNAMMTRVRAASEGAAKTRDD
jgi:hypothetical protein